jgi:uncharacterized Zn-finger protein
MSRKQPAGLPDILFTGVAVIFCQRKQDQMNIHPEIYLD